MAKLDFRRQHRAKSFADRSKIIAADPLAQLDQFRRQRRKLIHQFGDFFYLDDVGRPIGLSDADADHGPFSKGHDRATAHKGLAVEGCRDGVGERRVQRNWECDFAIARRTWQRNSVAARAGGRGGES